MKNISILLVTSLTSIASGLMAAAPDLSKLPPPAQQQGVTFDKDIKPLFEASCVRCHGADRPKNGLRLDSLERVLKGSNDGKVIAPGESQKSKLVLAVARLDNRSAMPPAPRPPRARGGVGGSTNAPANVPADANGGAPGNRDPRGPMGPPTKPLTLEQVRLVRAWVDQGAR